MNNQDRAAQVWKGPWKCKECGNVFHGIVLETAKKERWHFTTFSGPHEECTGELVPYDRRNLSQTAYGQERFRAGAEALIHKAAQEKSWIADRGGEEVKVVEIGDLYLLFDELLAEQEEQV